MRSRMTVLVLLGLLASGTVILFLLLPPVRNRIQEAWYLPRLDSQDRFERRRAAERLAEIGSQRMIPRLVALYPLDYGTILPYWVPQLLIRLGPSGIEAAFRFKLPDGRIHPGVFEALRELGPGAKAAVPALIACLDSEEDGLDAAFCLQNLGPEVVPPLIHALSEATPEGRKYAAYALGKSGMVADSSVPALMKALRDPEALVRENAAEALGAIGPSALEALPALMTALREDEELKVREEAANAIGKLGLGAKDAVPALVQALETDRVTLNETVNAMAEIDPDGSTAVPLLLKALADLPRDGPERIWAVFWALERFAGRSQEIGAALIERTSDKSPEIRRQATQALSALKSEASRARLLELLRDQDPETRFQAAFSLANQEVFPDAAIPIFLEALRDRAHRGNAACHLKGFGARAAPALPTLITLLKVHDPNANGWAIGAIAAAKDAIGDHLPALSALLSDPNEEIKQRAVQVLQDLGPAAAPAVPDLLKVLPTSDTETQEQILDTIGAIGPGAKDAIPALIPMLSSTDLNCSGSLQDHACLALGKIGEPVRTAMMDALDNADAQVRAAALGVLVHLPATPQTVTAHLRMLRDPAPLVRAAAASALGTIGKGAGEAIPALRPLLQDPDADVRLSASSALIALGASSEVPHRVLIALLEESSADLRGRTCGLVGKFGPAAAPAVPALIRLLKDDDRGVVQCAATALGLIGRGARPALPTLRELIDTLRGEPQSFIESAIEEIEAGSDPPH